MSESAALPSAEGTLRGARIGLTGTRKAEETAEYVRRLGGVPILAPAIETVSAETTAPDLTPLLDGEVRYAIFLTGVGVHALFRVAEERGQAEALHSALNAMTVISRGPKARGALKGHRVAVHWQPPEATLAAIAAGLNDFDLAGQTAMVQWPGFSDEAFHGALTARGARVIDLHLYRHGASPNEEPVLAMIEQIRRGDLDFLTFTSAIGVRGFFGIAEKFGRDDALLAALQRGQTRLVAVGSVTAAALAEVGAPPPLVPEIQTTGGMFRRVGEFLAENPLTHSLTIR